MAKKNDQNQVALSELLQKTKIQKHPLEDELKKSFIAYAMAVNVSRAIPDVRDGLKPVHRRILFSMNELGLTSDKAYRKCALIVGDVLGKYHPHGDSSVYDALVRLAQDFSIRNPLVDGHGNFGSIDGDPPAAYRYTEARMSKISSEMLRDLDKDTVDFYPNFDDTRMQPTVLPARFPNLLVNGSDGIAVGMATSIPPHNLGEVIEATVALIDNEELSVEDLMEYIPAPDYPTGALVLGRAAIRQAYKTGKGGAILRARTELEETENGKTRIIVKELPYQINKSVLIKAIADQIKDKRLEGISDLREESDRNGMRIVIELKRDANAQVVLNTLYKQTNLQCSNSMILLALVDGVPKVLNLKEILVEYIKHQITVIERRTRFNLNKALEREHILLGLVKALANIDEVIATIKDSKERADAIENLIGKFELSEKQAIAILEMRLQRLVGLEVEKLQQELSMLEKDIEEYRSILADPMKVKTIIKTEMMEIKEKFSTPRKSELSQDISEINIADLIEKHEVVLSMTYYGYVKRQPASEYRAQRRGGKGVTGHKTKEEDFVSTMYVCNSHDDIMFFTNMGKVYCIKAYEIPEASRTSKGRAIVNLLNLSAGEKVSAFMPINDYKDGYLMMATKNGLIKKTEISEFERIRANGKIAISLVESDELISVALTTGNEELLMACSSGKCIRFSEGNIRKTGRTSQGVKSMRMDEGEIVVDMAVVKEGSEVVTVTENGYGKRTDISDYRLQGRAGKGIKAGNFNEKTGKLICLKQVNPEDDIMLIADNGIIIRTKVNEISKIGRDTQGVRVMRVGEECKVVAVALTPSVDEEETTENSSENTENIPTEA